MAHKRAATGPTLADVFPGRDSLTVPTSVRFSARLLKRLDAIADAKGITRTETIERLLGWALDALDPEDVESVEDAPARRRRTGR